MKRFQKRLVNPNSMRFFGQKVSADITLQSEELSEWTKAINADPTLKFASTVAVNSNVRDALITRDSKTKYTTGVFNNVVTPEGAPRMNQKSSGRCWLFAATNTLRIPLMSKYNLEKIELSPAFLFFYDKLEKANFFLEQIVDTAAEDIDSRIVQHLLTDPVSDGGQFTMFANIIEKYGLVPMSSYGESASTENSAVLNELVTTLLRQYAGELREAIANKKDPKPLQKEQMKRIHQLLVLFLGPPPSEFDWEFVDKDNKYHSIKGLTPKRFAKECIGFNGESPVSLLNDPRNEYEKPVHVKRLGNVVEAGEVTYFNVDIDVLANKAIERIKENKPVFFGTHTPIYHHNKTGIIDTHIWDYESLGFKPTQSKADRLRYHQSLMTHAMVFTGVQLNDKGEPIRWKVENSWGKDQGKEGYYTMSHDFFKEYVYQVVVDKNSLVEYIDKLKEDAIQLEPWDPCGALAQ